MSVVVLEKSERWQEIRNEAEDLPSNERLWVALDLLAPLFEYADDIVVEGNGNRFEFRCDECGENAHWVKVARV